MTLKRISATNTGNRVDKFCQNGTCRIYEIVSYDDFALPETFSVEVYCLTLGKF